MICDGCGNRIDEFLTEEMVCPYCHKDINEIPKEYTENEENTLSENQENSRKIWGTEDSSPHFKTPLSTISFLLMQILFLLPILNLLFLFIFSFKTNINKNIKSFARSILTWYAVTCTALLALVTAMLILRYPLDLFFWFTKFRTFINNIPDF